MKRLTWRNAAIHRIANALLEYEAQCLLLGDAIDGKSAKKWISKERYPFGFREYTPYRIWLQEVAKIVLKLSQIPNKSAISESMLAP